jgi:hypothetical protein
MGRGVAVSRESGRPRRRAQSGLTGLTGLCAAVAALALAGCGSSQHFADNPRPATPIDLSVYVDNNHVSISPAHVGAGPVILYVTNQASNAQTLSIKSSKGSPIADTGTINSGQTAQLQTDLKTGTYSVTTGAKITGASIVPAKLDIGKPRQNADNVLLQP